MDSKMNERMKELFKREYGYYPSPGKLVEAEKFAELIVRECIDVFSKDMPDPTSPDYQLGSLPEVVNRVANVAEHFGVE
jgi:hypothetical protein